MRKLAMITGALALFSTPALAEDWDFILTNNSGKEVKKIELSATGADSWQENKVDPERKRDATVKSGGRITVQFDKGAGCRYDVKLTFADDSSSVWSGINVCDNSFVAVRYNASGATAFTAN